MKFSSRRIWLIAILLLAAILRLYGLERGDPMNDEVTYAFRAVGLVDSFNDPGVQSTPWDWLDPDIPSWARLSFHDHPPLVIWIQHLAMRVFGESPRAFRLPSAILGIASVALVYFIGARLTRANLLKSDFNRLADEAGLIAAAVLAVTLNHVYVSRAGLQESYVIFFILLALFFLLKSLENRTWLLAAGATAGLGFLAKYTALLAIPIILLYIAFYRRDYFREKYFWFGALLALIIASPVIIYNIGLYRSAGHFDLQFSHILGKTPEVWAGSPGKTVGSLANRVKIFLPRLMAANSWVFLGLAAISAAAFAALVIRRPGPAMRRLAIPALGTLSVLGLIAATGPAFRFLTLLTPFFALGIGAMLALIIKPAAPAVENSYSNVLKNIRIRNAAFAVAFALVIAFEAFYAVNNQIAYYPIGPRPWLASALRYENYNWGYNELDAYLERELDGKMPALTFETKYDFIRQIQERWLKRAKESGAEPYSALIVYYGNFDLAPELWIFDRRLMYRSWPIMPFEEYLDAIREKGADAFPAAGFQQIYFVMQTNIVPSPEFSAVTTGLEAVTIQNPRGEEAFRIYRLAPGFN